MENLDLNPWVISLDKEKTIEYYMNNDLSEDKSLNLALKKQLDSETLNFIERFGVDIKKARVCFIPSIFDEDDVGILSKDFYKLGFMFAGQLDAVPSVQWDFYFDRLDDEPPIFEVDETSPKRVEFEDLIAFHTSSDKMGVYKFSPAVAFDESLEDWNSGFVYCTAIFSIG
ncbi:hypothetical protein [Peptostreptococcus stomatis]|uniref:hypothetical protein n=1 Tax=Peptostreptococcus stomatis TaxID=341694 RepID=UPI0028E72065|nr:hypothetical protein [Peptostreptococcus stomatis]